ncbi:MAG: DUF2971 domain-containing protein [Gammaproteobacteria bacterium]
MLPKRRYLPSEDEVIYHYCSVDSFLAICTSKRLRFSDLFTMNDFMEMRWGYHMWERAAGAVIGSGEVDKGLIDDIDAVISDSTLRALPLASCFSRDGDVLSQWRAYADDGAGYALGFKASVIAAMAVHALRVEYDPEQQMAEIKTLIHAIREVESAEQQPRSPDFVETCARLTFDLAAFKNPAFSEEEEIRLIRLVNLEKSNAFLRLRDPGGTAPGPSADPQPVAFHISKGIPVAHIDLDFTNGGTTAPLAEVMLGPRNDALWSGVLVLLETLGLPGVKVRRSGASYR